MSFGLSTSWNAFRYNNGGDLLFEIKNLGFDDVELSFNLTSSMVAEMEGVVKNGLVNVLSLHNFCPIPDGWRREEALPDCYSLSSTKEDERKLAIKFTQRSIDTAKNLGARVLVIHCGRVAIADRTGELIELYETKDKNSAKFLKLSALAVKERSSFSKKSLENLFFSLEELILYAKEKGIILGIENRYYYPEIPALEEIGVILNKFRGSNIRYWHDTGHAQTIENLGFAKHKDYLDLYGKEMIGIHLHDIVGCHDHLAPSKGKFEFKMLKPHLKKETLKIMEIHHPATAQDVQEARDFLTRVLNE